MLDTNATLLALRARAKSLTAITTGLVSLSATANGYARATGSFLDDGFEVGMEITPASFGVNTADVLTGVSATLLTTKNAHATQTASNRTISVKLPTLRAWSNIALTDAVTNQQYLSDAPPSGRPYLTENFVTGQHGMVGYPDEGGDNDERGLYALTWYGLEGLGEGAIRKPVDALKRLFAPGTVLVAAGAKIRMQRNQGVIAPQIIPQGNGWAALQMQVSWWARSTNTVAA